METQLASNLLLLASIFACAKHIEETTVGRHCASDGRFFVRIREGKTFTVKKYDEVVQWFSLNWPEDIPWPVLRLEDGIGRHRCSYRQCSDRPSHTEGV